jgi:hypothetical protein
MVPRPHQPAVDGTDHQILPTPPGRGRHRPLKGDPAHRARDRLALVVVYPAAQAREVEEVATGELLGLAERVRCDSGQRCVADRTAVRLVHGLCTRKALTIGMHVIVRDVYPTFATCLMRGDMPVVLCYKWCALNLVHSGMRRCAVWSLGVHARSVQARWCLSVRVFFGVSDVGSRSRRSSSAVALGCMERRIVLVLAQCVPSWALVGMYKGVVCLSHHSFTCHLEPTCRRRAHCERG